MNRFNMLKRGNTEGTEDTKIQILTVVFQVRFEQTIQFQFQ